MLHVLTPLYATGTIVMLTLVFETVLGGKKCSLDQYINKNGKCRYCKFCPAGEGMNFTAQVPTDENDNPLRCHPCIPCPSGTYNDPAARQYGCSQCLLNCWLMNRKEYEPCGETTSGNCGACLNSSYEDRDNNMDSPCYKRNEVEIKRVKFIATNDKFVSKNDDENVDYVKTLTQHNTWWIYVIIGGLGFAVAFVTVMVALVVVRKYKFPRKCADLIPSLSGVSLMESSTSAGQDNNGVSHKYEKVSPDDLDIETDGPSESHIPHREIEHLHSTGPAALHITKELDTKHTVKKQRSYPDIVVEVGNAYFNYLSKHLYGHQVPEIFRRLDVRDQTIFAELELFELNKIKYEDAIYRLLLSWVRLKTTNATLAFLCPVLEENGMKKLSEQLLCLAENKLRNTEYNIKQETSRSTNALAQENIEIPERRHTCQVEDEDLVKSGEQSDHSQMISEINNCIKEDKISLDSSVESLTTFDTDYVVVERETSL